MKARIRSKEFAKQVQLAALAAAGKMGGLGTEILACLKIEALEEEIVITGVNLVWSMVKRFEAEVMEPGIVAVTARMLAEAVPFCGDEYTRLETVKGKLRIQSGNFLIEISSMPVNSFPVLEQEDVEYFFQMPAEQLCSMIQAVSSNAADENTRPVLAGTLLKTEYVQGMGSALTLAAADGFRLAEENWPVEIPGGMKDIYTVIPAKAFEKLAKHLEGEKTVMIALTVKGKMQFRYSGTTVVINPIHAMFPDYQTIIPTEAETIASFDVVHLLDGLRSGRLIGLHGDFQIRPDKNGGGNVSLEVISESGHIKNQIEARVEGEPQDIRLNLQYLREAIEGCSILGYDRVYLATTGTEKPVLVTPTQGSANKDKPRARFIIMPMMNNRRVSSEDSHLSPAIASV